MHGLTRLLRFFADHNDVLLEVVKWDKAEFAALTAGVIDSWATVHREDVIRLASDILDMIKDRHEGGEANG